MGSLSWNHYSVCNLILFILAMSNHAFVSFHYFFFILPIKSYLNLNITSKRFSSYIALNISFLFLWWSSSASLSNWFTYKVCSSYTLNMLNLMLIITYHYTILVTFLILFLIATVRSNLFIVTVAFSLCFLCLFIYLLIPVYLTIITLIFTI